MAKPKDPELESIKQDIRDAKRRQLKDDLVDSGETEEDAAIIAREAQID